MTEDTTQTNFFNIDDPTQGIARALAPGLAARVFPGEQAMVSVVRLEPGARGRCYGAAEPGDVDALLARVRP